MNTEKTLEFDKIKKKLEEHTCTQKAKQMVQNLQPFLSEKEVLARLSETTQAKVMIEKCGNPPMTALQDIDTYMQMAEKGGCLTPEQLEMIERTLVSVRRLKAYLERAKQYDLSLAYYEENLDPLEEICEELGQKIRAGQVDDYASKTLRSLRTALDNTKQKMQDKASAALKTNKTYLSDNFSTMRNGHICIPVKKEYKFKVNGSVIDKSSTGSTLFIEPTTVTKHYEELQELQIDEENEVLRILYTLSALLSDKAQVFEQNNRTIEKLDFIFAKAKLSLEYDGIEPGINTKRWIRLKNGRHPLMEKSVNVPLNFEIGNGISGIVITGPNTGGKTVAIKTVALNCMMAQCGLHVAGEEADICMNNAILCDIGDGQNLAENLSTFSAHIKNVLDILRKVSAASLVIMDELGSGTDPAEGMGIAVAILEELKRSQALFLVTTHYPEIKEYAEREQGIVNARMTFDKESLQPKYELVIGKAGESCAFHIAGRLGMPRRMLETAAKAAYGEETTTDFSGDLTDELQKEWMPKMQREKTIVKQTAAQVFGLGDSVRVLPEQKIGIVCKTANEKGVLRVQMADKKIWINHKRVKMHVKAEQLYPEDYDFSILFEGVEQRKIRHDMERKYVDKVLEYF